VQKVNQDKQNDSKAVLTKPTRMADLIDYQEGSVVSRTIVDKKSGTVTLFAFDKGEGLSEHMAPYDAFINVLDGEAEVTVAGKTFALGEGEIVVVPAKKPHALKATQRFKMLLVMVRG
jgi:quercetin dioxygenase-like cupin family protein